MTQKSNWKRAVININNKINFAIKKLDFAEVQILMVVNNRKKFVGTITDGDVRRGLIKGINLDDNIDKIVNFNPTVVPPGTEINSVKDIMSINSINQLPIIDKKKNSRSTYIKRLYKI